MEPNETRLPSYYHQHHHQHHHQNSPTTTGTTAQPTNGLLPNTEGVASPPQSLLYPHSSQPSTADDTVAKRKRGRPRKYATPEQALAAKKTTSLTSPSSSSMKKLQQVPSLGTGGQGFTAHIISAITGEDVAQKIIMFMQRSQHEICILSASGSISNATLRQPATSGGSITYEGRFEILSLSGSYVRTDVGGRTGGLSICLSSMEGQIIGGGVGGPLTAAGPVQVIVGTFLMEPKKDDAGGAKGDASAGRMASPVGGASVSSAGYRPVLESPPRVQYRSSDDHQNFGGNQFMTQSSAMHNVQSPPTDWRGGLSSGTYDFTGRTDLGGHQSPENGEYDD